VPWDAEWLAFGHLGDLLDPLGNRLAGEALFPDGLRNAADRGDDLVGAASISADGLARPVSQDTTLLDLGNAIFHLVDGRLGAVLDVA
jgi:hypothetical protein